MEENTENQLENNFKQFYYSKINPRLAEHNKYRKKELCLFLIDKIILFTFITLTIGLLIDIYIIKSQNYNDAGFRIFAILILLILLKLKDFNQSEKKLKTQLMHDLLNIFFDKGYYRKTLPDQKFDEKIVQEHLLTDYCIRSFDDIFTATYKDVDITMYEIDTYNITQRISYIITVFCIGAALAVILSKGIIFILNIALILWILFMAYIAFINKWHMIHRYSHFKGLIIILDMDKKFTGHTFFLENSISSPKVPFNTRDYEKVNLESVSFEKKYQVYSDDQIEARYVLTTSMVERIENLETVFKAKYIRGSFKDNKLTLAIHTNKDMFAMGSDIKDSDYKTFHVFYEEMLSIRQIIDALKLYKSPQL